MPEMTQESNTWSLYSSPDYLLTTATCPVVNALQRYFILAGELLSMNAWAARRRHRRSFAERTPSVIFHAKSCRLIVRPEEKKKRCAGMRGQECPFDEREESPVNSEITPRPISSRASVRCRRNSGEKMAEQSQNGAFDRNLDHVMGTCVADVPESDRDGTIWMGHLRWAGGNFVESRHPW
jgi:hypothetical protein